MNIIKKLNIQKSVGIDSIRSIDRKNIAANMVNVLTHLINIRLCIEIYPSKLKSGMVRPINKIVNKKIMMVIDR